MPRDEILSVWEKRSGCNSWGVPGGVSCKVGVGIQPSSEAKRLPPKLVWNMLVDVGLLLGWRYVVSCF